MRWLIALDRLYYEVFLFDLKIEHKFEERPTTLQFE